ncbi:hypothetical protein DYB38_002952 [Aphanomyces astaci]|uniref:Uncharacterized protein n=2 Tax=Aphanomyces astaci TaxID=112090 RepID=A0A397C7Q5_APHAT|nr:hypothetical protein DYB38_002952 [Aphanomyces astaci]
MVQHSLISWGKRANGDDGLVVNGEPTFEFRTLSSNRKDNWNTLRETAGDARWWFRLKVALSTPSQLVVSIVPTSSNQDWTTQNDALMRLHGVSQLTDVWAVADTFSCDDALPRLVEKEKPRLKRVRDDTSPQNPIDVSKEMTDEFETDFDKDDDDNSQDNVVDKKSMNFLVGILLLFHPEADAFWLLCVLMDQYLPTENYSNPMAAYAMNHGAKMMEDQVKSFMPGAAAGALNMFGSVKYYFTVNNTYVVHRLKMLLCPFIHKDWRRIVQNEGNNTGVDVVYAPPSMDKNAPDLYIPLMSFVTYILIVGYIKGASGRFNPDVITEVSTYCCLMQLVEICLMKLGLYLLNSQINWLDLVSFTGYKYVALVINTVVHLILGYIPYYVVLAYTGIATSFFTLNGLKGTVPEPNHDQRRFRNYMLLAYVSRFDF